MNFENVYESLLRAMKERYGISQDSVRIVRAPYRICPLGAHIDHQLGVVSAMALDEAVHLAFAPSGSTQVCVSSLDFPGVVSFDTTAVPEPTPGFWGNYIQGAVKAFGAKARQGVFAVSAGTWAEGGLSSSAAIGIAYLLALQYVNELDVSPQENIELDRRIENAYLGLKNGILDQAAVLCSKAGALTVIDCREFEATPMTAIKAIPGARSEALRSFIADAPGVSSITSFESSFGFSLLARCLSGRANRTQATVAAAAPHLAARQARRSAAPCRRQDLLRAV